MKYVMIYHIGEIAWKKVYHFPQFQTGQRWCSHVGGGGGGQRGMSREYDDTNGSEFIVLWFLCSMA